ncbi:MAG: EthD family reductase [Chloroflexi bacterium]|nr:EthD family reductase [Chloroflexota bacterium]
MIRVVVEYPNQPGTTFDEAYYLGRHIPLVQQRLGPLGMVRCEVDKGLAGGAPGAPAPYLFVAHLYFNRLEDLQNAMATHGAEVMGDIPNYTNIQPTIQIGEIVSS